MCDWQKVRESTWRLDDGKYHAIIYENLNENFVDIEEDDICIYNEFRYESLVESKQFVDRFIINKQVAIGLKIPFEFVRDV